MYLIYSFITDRCSHSKYVNKLSNNVSETEKRDKIVQTSHNCSFVHLIRNLKLAGALYEKPN